MREIRASVQCVQRLSMLVFDVAAKDERVLEHASTRRNQREQTNIIDPGTSCTVCVAACV
eukprot:1490968-Rhodomonas_salina.1